MNPVEIDEAVSALALETFDRGEFAYQFLTAFGSKGTAIQRLRAGATNQSDVSGGILQRGNIHIATCAPGEVDETLSALRRSPKTASQKAKFILATDGIEFQAEDMRGGGTVACTYAQFADHFGFFLPLAGITTVEQIRESAFDIKATGRLNKLYVELLKDNPDWASRQQDMNHFMARLIFCFFAEDTDIFLGDALFSKTIEQMSARDASDTNLVMTEIFRAMDTKPAERDAAGVKRYAKQFPYVNGLLFSGSTECPHFSKIARSYLLHIASLDWQKINPDIFGSMIQAVADDEERGALGMHYTSVPNILKVLNPLFLDDLRNHLEEAGDNARKLLNLRSRMAKIRVFDPACGSGNFLVIAYKEMRAIEAEINRRRGEPDRRSEIPLTNFRGIELRDFPAEIARLALIIAEYQCDVLYRGQKEALAEFLPLDSQNWITCGNALRLDWLSICPPTGTGVKVRGDDLFQTPLDQSEIDFANAGGETYLCGNPPYKGAKYQTTEQKSDLKLIAGHIGSGYANLDYVACWFIKGAEYIRECGISQFAFVATNSICQGQSVSTLWPKILRSPLAINFAYDSFVWSNLASNKAAVIVSVIGVGPKVMSPRLFVETDGDISCREVSNINAYLVPAQDIFVDRQRRQISNLSEMESGSKMTDGSNLVFEKQEVDEIVRAYPEAAKFFKKIVGGADLVSGLTRWSVWIEDEEASQAAAIPPIKERLERTAVMRRSSSKLATQVLAGVPHRFDERRFYRKRFVAIPQTSSERRYWLSCNYYEEDVILIAPHLFMPTNDLYELAVILSRVHLAWVAAICGKLKNDYRYSNTMGWNTFPLPKLTEQNKADLTACAENILLAREAHFPATIADLYDPEAMPENLRRAHEENDEVLERIYIGRRFKNDTERLEKLFELYTKMTGRGKAA